MSIKNILRTTAIALAVAALAAAFCGCSDGGAQAQSYNDAQSAANREAQSLWQVLNAAGELDYYLSDDSEEVKQIMGVLAAHHAIVDGRKAGSLGLEEEFSLYSSDFCAMLDNNSYKEAVSDMYEDNGITLVPGGQIWYASTLDKSLTSAKVTVDCEFTIEECSQEYLEKCNMTAGTEYVEQRIYYMEKLEGLWRITSITKSAVAPVAEM